MYPSKLVVLCFFFIFINIVGCGSAPTAPPKPVQSEPPVTKSSSSPEAVTIPAQTYASGASYWYLPLNHRLDQGFEFIRVLPDNPVALNFVSDSSLDNLTNPSFWGYALRHTRSGKILPIYGELKGQGRNLSRDKYQPVRYRGYFKLHQFQPYDNKQSLSAALENIAFVGFAGDRTFAGETHRVVSNLVANPFACEWKYNFWNSKQRFWGSKHGDLLSFHARVGRPHDQNGEQWRVYTNLPRTVILDLESPTIEVLKSLMTSVGELPRVQYMQRKKYATDHVDCHRAHAQSGRSVGYKQHRYSLFYPRLKQFGKLMPVETDFRWTLSQGVLKGANRSIATKAGSLSKFLLMGEFEPWLTQNKKPLPIAKFNEYSADVLYALGPDYRLELWRVDPNAKTPEVRLFNPYGHKVSYRFPVSRTDLEALVAKGSLGKCDDQTLLVGACDGSRYPTVLISNRGEQTEIWHSAEKRVLHSWSPAKGRFEQTALAPLSAGAEAIAASKATFVCQQLEENLAKIDRRLQRRFISDRPYSTWYENDVPRLMGYAQRAVYAPRYDEPRDVASKLDDRERSGSRELRKLLGEARRAERLASADYCPETKALAADYVPLVEELYREVNGILNDIWKDVEQQADQIAKQIFYAKRAKDKRDHEAWKRQFWANSMQQLRSTMDITSTVNQITAQTNAMYNNALKIQEAQRAKREQLAAQRKAQQQAAAAQKATPPKPSAPPVSKAAPSQKPAYEGFPKQQSFTINVPNAVSLKDLDKATSIGGTTPVTINPGGGHSSNNGGTNTGAGENGNNIASTPKPPKPPKPKGKRLLESLSFCKPSKYNEEKWFCEGRTQKLFTSEDLDEALESSGCLDIRRWVPLREGRLYFCNQYRIDTTGNTGKATWNRDIARWIDIPASILADRREFFE